MFRRLVPTNLAKLSQQDLFPGGIESEPLRFRGNIRNLMTFLPLHADFRQVRLVRMTCEHQPSLVGRVQRLLHELGDYGPVHSRVAAPHYDHTDLVSFARPPHQSLNLVDAGWQGLIANYK